MLKHAELYFLDVITGKKKGIFPLILKTLLIPFSWIYGFFAACRNWAFDHGWLRRYSPPVPVVISVGNIVAGGTGKTPVTLMLAKEFYEDVPIAILARGYRSEAEKLSTPIVLSRGQGPMHPASYCGDESFMLSQNLPKAFIFVGKDRHKSSNMAAKAGVKVILLDDGMQHRRLARDFEIVVMDAYDPFGQGYYLPRGLLREGVKSLARADLIILNHVHEHEAFMKIRQRIASYSTAPVAATKIEASKVFDINNKVIGPITGKKVGIFCGIAHPDYFRKTILDLGAEVVDTHYIADHRDYDFGELAAFAQQCKEKNAELIICTEKDRVKLVESLQLPLPIAWVQMRLVFVEGETLWRSFIEKAKMSLDRNF